jgi:acetolactate synthase-1/2/3 large subunit
MTGAAALTETLLAEGVGCVFGIPGAQQNELWDTFKSKHLEYLLVTHEFSAATMADGYARSTGRPGVLCVVPGPGLTNALGGLGEALLDSIPVVCIVGDVARGDKYRPFQVHELPQVPLLRQVTKAVYEVQGGADIPLAVREAFRLAASGEPGPVGVVVPWNLLIEQHRYHSGPLAPAAVPFDEAAFHRALHLLANRRLRVGIYAGLGCMPYSASLVRAAETLQAPVATSISGKGVIPENHPLAVGWGYGPQGTRTAEQVFRHVDLVLAIGVRFSEVSTGYYAQPQPRHLIHVDINANNLGKILRAEVCVHADAGLFLDTLLQHADAIRRPCDNALVERIRAEKAEELKGNREVLARCGADPMAFLLALRCAAAPDALAFVDVTCAQYWATEVFTTLAPRTFFNPTNNQAMGWSIPAALGAQRVHPGRQVLTITGDGCLLMSAMEISTAARERLPVKFFVLDDQAYHYMQALQRPAYLRTTATILARLDYRALAQGWGVAYQELSAGDNLEASLRAALCHDGPLLVRVVTDYRRRPIRWIDAARGRFIRELSFEQKVRFLARIGSRALEFHPQND